ncbi:hypothetical protein V7S43_009920 [Phytophthora oleae]|uniref:Uncharacterized protein n=1 Tax=Phytophthora oleae TaxID=2107226 RepID=A0ABD3FFW1_9STRA
MFYCCGTISVVIGLLTCSNVSWNKPFKSGLRSLWFSRLRDQLVEYRGGSDQRERKRLQLQNAIHKARQELTQANADIEVARLRQHHTEEVFKLKPPSRSDITHWVSPCWGYLSASTIINGFRKVGILNDTRVVEDGASFDVIESGIVQELECCKLASGDVDSDDDIGSGDELGSGSEDDA